MKRKRFGAMGFDHDSVNHSVSEYVDGQVHTNGIESFWAMLKRGYHGTFSAKHLHRYVREFANRHNARDKDTEDDGRLLYRDDWQAADV